MRTLIAITVALALQACAASASRELLLRQDAPRALTAGEDVTVEFNDGRHMGTTVSAVNADELVTPGGHYAWSDIAYITHDRTDTVQNDIGKVQMVSLGVLAGALLLVALLL